MLFKRMVLASFAVVACGEHGGPDAAPYTLCDGTVGIRLSLVSTGGGPVPDTFLFTHPLGWRFLHVDGSCHFVASTEVPGQVASGDFSAQQAEQLAQALGLADVSGLTYRFRELCPDAPSLTVTTPDAYIETGCGDRSPPDRVVAALAWEPAFALAAEAGQPSRGPVSVLALRVDGPLEGAARWPFSFPVEQALFTPGVDTSYLDVPRAAKLLSGDDAALARQLWATERGSRHDFVAVRSGDEHFELYFRDELDPVFAAELDARGR